MPKRKPIAKGLYKHYKGQLYEVLGEAHHSETLEEFIIYKALYNTKYGKNSLWARPKKMFLEKVLVNNKLVARFKKQSPRQLPK